MGFVQRFSEGHTDTACQTEEQREVCKISWGAVGKARVENLFSRLTQKCQFFLAEGMFRILSSPMHTLFPASSALSKK